LCLGVGIICASPGHHCGAQNYASSLFIFWGMCGVKQAILHEHFCLPPPGAFELFCAVRRVPLPNTDTSASAWVPSLAAAAAAQSSDDAPLTVADALRLLPPDALAARLPAAESLAPPQLLLPLLQPSARLRPPVVTLALLLLPSAPLDLAMALAGSWSVRVTTFAELDRAHPKPPSPKPNHKPSSKKPVASASKPPVAPRCSLAVSSETPAAAAGTSPLPPDSFLASAASGSAASAAPFEHRPSRPAAHPKERASKARNAFAGLRRGFFASTNKENRPSKAKRRPPVDSPPASPLGPHAALASPATPPRAPPRPSAQSPRSPSASAKQPFAAGAQGAAPHRADAAARVAGALRARCVACARRLKPWNLALGPCKCGACAARGRGGPNTPTFCVSLLKLAVLPLDGSLLFMTCAFSFFVYLFVFGCGAHRARRSLLCAARALCGAPVHL